MPFDNLRREREERERPEAELEASLMRFLQLSGIEQLIAALCNAIGITKPDPGRNTGQIYWNLVVGSADMNRTMVDVGCYYDGSIWITGRENRCISYQEWFNSPQRLEQELEYAYRHPRVDLPKYL